MKKIVFILILIAAVFLVLGFFKDIVIKVSVERGVELVTGLKLKAGVFHVGMIKSVVVIKDLEIFNPDGFKDRIMLSMPEVYIDYDLPAALKGKIRLKELRIWLKELLVVRNEKGELNLDSLKVVKAEKKGAGEKEKRPLKIEIDDFRLKVEKAAYKDYSRPGAPKTVEFNVNLDERYTGIKDPYALVGLIVVRTLSGTTISRLANFDMGALNSAVSSALGSATKAAGETIKSTHEAARHVAGEMEKTVKKAREKLGGVIKAPFGKPE